MPLAPALWLFPAPQAALDPPVPLAPLDCQDPLALLDFLVRLVLGGIRATRAIGETGVTRESLAVP